jgi:tRNA nucleotidyltransferase/poly(A) polymerase
MGSLKVAEFARIQTVRILANPATLSHGGRDVILTKLPPAETPVPPLITFELSRISLPAVDPTAAREFAVEVVRKLRDAGHQALWAGGCVRDQLLGIRPKDYDVATSARPEQVRDLFGHRRSLPIGAAFGVITVLGPKPAGQIEVATFRRDAGYSDGRHPDSVTFSDAREDAQRRDFTINGLFFDPVAEQVIDYVGGQDDLQTGVIRAIGVPRDRITEDKLRMLRAVRFAAKFGFAIEANTLTAVQEQSNELVIVSAERIAEELRKMLTLDRRRLAVELLGQAQLLEIVLPEARGVHTVAWQQALEMLERITPSFPQGLAMLLRPLAETPETLAQLVDRVCRRLKLSVEELTQVQRLLREEPLLRRASYFTWPQLQRLLATPGVEAVLDFAAAVSAVLDASPAELDLCNRMLELPPALMNPAALINGEDLKLLGLSPGPHFRIILEQVRDAQLEGLINSPQHALELARKLARELGL